MSLKIKIVFFSWVLLAACSDEQPAPDAFLDYNHPYYERVNHEILNNLDNDISNNKFGEIHSLIIIRNDQIIYEKYYNGYKREDLHSVGESTQSVLSAMAGIILTDDSSLGLDTPVYRFFPEHEDLIKSVPQKDKIALQHLMTNTSGFWWNEQGGSDENNAFLMTRTDDWIRYVLSTPMIREPGHEFNLNSGNAILAGAIFQKYIGTDLEGYAAKRLFAPLGIKEWNWERTPRGQVNTAWGLSLRPMDFAKIGYLYLKKGEWEGNQIFDRHWPGISTKVRTGSSLYFNYGYFWWRFTYYADINKYVGINDTYFARGHGGQFLFVVPHQQMVIVMTAGNYNNDNDDKAFEILRDYIFAAVAFNNP